MNQQEPKTILVVDDEADIVRYLKMALEDAGFNVITASNGVEALEKVQQQVPDAISLDIVMPKGSGVKFFRELQKNSEWAKIPTIVVTGHARDDLGKSDFNEMTISGPGIYLEKPVTPETYVKAMRKVLGIDDVQVPDLVNLKDEVKSIVESADPATLKEIFKMLHDKKQ